VYDAFNERYNGMLKRDEFWWLHHVNSPGYHFVAAFNDLDEPIGYLMYKIEKRKLEVEEYISLNDRAFKLLWNFICQHDSMVEQLTINWCDSDGSLFLLDNRPVKLDVSPYFMGRIIDARKFLSLYPFQKDEKPLFLHIYDEYALWNSSTYRILDGKVKIFQKETVQSTCAHPPKRGLQLDIQTLTAALLGYQSVKQLQRIGKNKRG
jgi:predicted acetyltransferase